jgi:hypothetical protein
MTINRGTRWLPEHLNLRLKVGAGGFFVVIGQIRKDKARSQLLARIFAALALYRRDDIALLSQHDGK